jgi:hypothetical protein
MGPYNDGQNMRLVELHAERRIAAALHCDSCAKPFATPDDAAAHFGLRPLGAKWRAIDRKTSERVLFALLIEDMAFSSPRLSTEEAEEAISSFLSPFTSGARFYTNGSWEAGWTRSEDGRASYGPDWEPATDATFDGGVIALDDSRAAVLWLEDED